MMEFFRRLFTKSSQPNDPTDVLVEPVVETLESPLAAVEGAEDQTTGPLQTRPLPPPKQFSGSSRRIIYGQSTNVGQVRSNNQDACLSLLGSPEIASKAPSIGFFVVADGMGGYQDGELASQITVQTLTHHVIEQVIQPHLNGQEHTSDQKTIPEVLAEAMVAANEAVQTRVPQGGTTATCSIIRGDLAYIAHIGDSRAYLITDDNMELVTRDHSLVRRLQELGQLTPEEAEVHPQRNVLYRAIGQGDAVESDAATRRLPPSSRLMLCSDGLWGVVGDEKLAEVLRQNPDPQEACEKLVELANAMGGPDNITVVLVQMPD